MASSTKIMSDVLEGSKVTTLARGFSQAVLKKNIDEIIKNYEGLRDIELQLIAIMVKRALRLIHEQTKKEVLLDFFLKLITLDKIPAEKLKAIGEGVLAYLKEFYDKKLIEEDISIRDALMNMALENIDEAIKKDLQTLKENFAELKKKSSAPIPSSAADEFKRMWKEDESKMDVTPVERIPTKPAPTTNGDFSIWKQIEKLKAWAIQYEKEMDDDMLDSSPTESPSW